VPGHAAQQQVLEHALAVPAYDDGVAVLSLLLLDQTKQSIAFDDAGVSGAWLQAGRMGQLVQALGGHGACLHAVALDQTVVHASEAQLVLKRHLEGVKQLGRRARLQAAHEPRTARTHHHQPGVRGLDMVLYGVPHIALGQQGMHDELPLIGQATCRFTCQLIGQLIGQS